MTPPENGPATARRAFRTRTASALAALPLALLGACSSADPVSAPVPAPSEVPTSTPPVVTATPTADTPSPIPSAKPPRKAPATRKPPAMINEGTWLVGDDIPAGVYRTLVPVFAEEECYWKKARDSEGVDIIANDLPTGGRPQVTLSKGQWFTTSAGCGVWVRR